MIARKRVPISKTGMKKVFRVVLMGMDDNPPLSKIRTMGNPLKEMVTLEGTSIHKKVAMVLVEAV
jgi:hypothetical protein